MTGATGRRAWLALALALSCASGCHWNETQIIVEPGRDSNNGRPLRMLVRAVEPRSFVTEPYQAVAQKVVTADDSVLRTAILYPGAPYATWIKRGLGKSVAIYFFFTTPGTRWKTLLNPPLPRLETIHIEGSELRSADHGL